MLVIVTYFAVLGHIYRRKDERKTKFPALLVYHTLIGISILGGASPCHSNASLSKIHKKKSITYLAAKCVYHSNQFL